MVVESSTAPKGRFSDLLNMDLVEWRKDLAVVQVEVDERHLNTLSVAHGGVLLSAMDNALGMCLTFREPPASRRYCVTINMNATFHAPMRIGRLIVTARRTGGGRSIAFCEAEAKDGNGQLVGTASGTFKILRDKVENANSRSS